MFKKHMNILVGIDGSDNSMLALKEAMILAKKFDGTIIIVTVYTKENGYEFDRIRKDVYLLLEGTLIFHKFIPVQGSNPARALIDLSKKEKIDLVVVGNRGLGKAASFLLGSVSMDVASKTRCDVLIVKQ